MRSAQSWAASRRQQRLHGGARKSRFRCLSIRSAAAHAHSKQLANGLERAEVLPTLPLADELLQPPLRANLSLDQRRVCKPSGSGIDGGHREGHADATGEVARSLSDIACLPRCLLGQRSKSVAAGPEMAGKASEPF